MIIEVTGWKEQHPGLWVKTYTKTGKTAATLKRTNQRYQGTVYRPNGEVYYDDQYCYRDEATKRTTAKLRKLRKELTPEEGWD